MSTNQKFYLLLLERLLLEMRNLDDEHLQRSRELAYIFHNVPGLLQSDLTDSDVDESIQVIVSRAEYFHMKSWINEWIHSAKV